MTSSESPALPRDGQSMLVSPVHVTFAPGEDSSVCHACLRTPLKNIDCSSHLRVILNTRPQGQV